MNWIFRTLSVILVLVMVSCGSRDYTANTVQAERDMKMGDVSNNMMHDGIRNARKASKEKAYRANQAASPGMVALASSENFDNAREGQRSPTGRQDDFKMVREVIYTAQFYVLVESADVAKKQVIDWAIEKNGYMQQAHQKCVVVKVPSEHFDAFVEQIKTLGDVLQDNIRADDVTDRMRDLRIRLANAEKMRERFVKLLDMAESVEDAIKVEKELARITEQIELYKGQLKQLSHQVTFSTITVNFNEAPKKEVATYSTPFVWLSRLGQSISKTYTGRLYQNDSWFKDITMELPEDFIRFSVHDRELQAMSADGVYVTIRQQSNYDKGKALFWNELVKKSLRQVTLMKIDDEFDLKTEGPDAHCFVGSKEVAGTTYSCLIGVCVKDRFVYTIEIWGAPEVFEAKLDVLRESLGTLDVK